MVVPRGEEDTLGTAVTIIRCCQSSVRACLSKTHATSVLPADPTGPRAWKGLLGYPLLLRSQPERTPSPDSCPPPPHEDHRQTTGPCPMSQHVCSKTATYKYTDLFIIPYIAPSLR